MYDAIIANHGAAVATLLHEEVSGERCYDKNLNDYLVLAVDHFADYALSAILHYEPSDAIDALDLDHILAEEERWTLLNYISSTVFRSGACFKMMKLSLKAGADPNISDNNGYTSLHNIASSKIVKDQNAKIITLLLAHHANPNLKTNDGFTCFEALLFYRVKGIDDWGLPGDGVEEKLLPCIHIFLKHHAEAGWNFYHYAEVLKFTRILKVLNDTEVYPFHIQATYATKKSITQQLKALPLKLFKLNDADRNKPSDIAKKYKNTGVIALLEKYEAVYQRRQLMEANYERSGSGLPPALRVTRVEVAEYLTPQEFGFFSETTNMHIKRTEAQSEATNLRLKLT